MNCLSEKAAVMRKRIAQFEQTAGKDVKDFEATIRKKQEHWAE